MGFKLDKINFEGNIEKGRLVLKNRGYFLHHISKFNDCRVNVRIERQRRMRSNAQNAFWWGACLEVIAEDTGDTKEALHAHFKAKCMPKRAVKVMGRIEYLPYDSTADLSTGEFSEFIFNVEQEVGYPMPDPKDYHYGV